MPAQSASRGSTAAAEFAATSLERGPLGSQILPWDFVPSLFQGTGTRGAPGGAWADPVPRFVFQKIDAPALLGAKHAILARFLAFAAFHPPLMQLSFRPAFASAEFAVNGRKCAHFVSHMISCLPSLFEQVVSQLRLAGRGDLLERETLVHAYFRWSCTSKKRSNN